MFFYPRGSIDSRDVPHRTRFLFNMQLLGGLQCVCVSINLLLKLVQEDWTVSNLEGWRIPWSLLKLQKLPRRNLVSV